MSKILILSPFSTHPPTEGNRQRVLALAEAMTDAGHEVHLALLPNNKFEDGDLEGMQAYWGPRLHRLYPFHRWTPGFRVRRIVARMLSPLLVRALGLRERGDIIPSVDQIYYDWWDIQLMLLQQRHRFDVVFAEYIFVSRALSVFPGSVHKLIDTIDIFSDRDELMREKRNIASNWLSTDTASEGLALGRGDVSIGIQDDESAELRKLTTGKVVTVGHFIDLVDCPRPTPTGVGQRLLFIGSSNALNVDGCAWFIDQVLDRVAAELPQVRLRIVGGVSQPLAERYADDPRLDIVGRVETLDQEYAAADVVINPVLFGTGLATKSIEALAHGAAMLCTAEGARGIPMDVAGGPPCGVAVTAESFADQLIELLKDPALRQRYQQSATAFVHDWNQQQAANLAAVLRP